MKGYVRYVAGFVAGIILGASAMVVIHAAAYDIPSTESIKMGPGGVLTDFRTGVIDGIDPPSIGGRSSVDVVISNVPDVAHVADEWNVFVSPQSNMEADVFIASARVSADSTLTIRFGNLASGSTNPAALSIAYTAIR